MRHVTSFKKSVKVFASACAALLLAGCGLGGGITASKGPATTANGVVAINGNVHGGQQPVSGATINMYTVGTTGYGSPAVSILKPGVTVQSSTDGSGSFSLTDKYTCTPDQRVYITAIGGDAGSGPNSAIALMAALGRCGDLTSSTFISLNEVTTVASIWALAPFITGITNIGAPASNLAGINNAFDDVNTLSSVSTGSVGGPNQPAGATIPVRAVNTLADILAACINSNGSDSGCSILFAGATGGAAPTDTITAAINMAQHPATGIAMLYPLATPQSPFQPTLSDQPSDFTLAATFSGFTAPTSVAADASGKVWVADAGSNTLTQLAHSGAPLMTTTGLNSPSSVAIDQTGKVWVANAGNSSLARVMQAGAVSTFSGGGLSSPKSISIDGQGNIWIANPDNNTLSEFGSTGAALSGSGLTGAGGTPIAIAVNPN